MKKKVLLFSGITTTLAAAATGLFGFALSNKLMYIQKKIPNLFVNVRQLPNALTKLGTIKILNVN
ncbi:hypothetical protein LSPH26S_04293 [Lysinibacillus sphaericus]